MNLNKWLCKHFDKNNNGYVKLIDIIIPVAKNTTHGIIIGISGYAFYQGIKALNYILNNQDPAIYMNGYEKGAGACGKKAPANYTPNATKYPGGMTV